MTGDTEGGHGRPPGLPGRAALADAPVRVAVLGPLELTVGGQPVHIGGPHRRVVLALLALGRGTVIPLSRLIAGVWDTRPPRSAGVKVQGHVSALRKSLATAGCPDTFVVLSTRSPGYRLDAEACVTDVDEFLHWRRLADEARLAGHAGPASSALGRALACWRGPALADVSGPEMSAHAVRLEELRLAATDDKADADLRLGHFREVVESLGPVVDAEPLREPTRALLIRALAALGQRHAALNCYEQGRRHLRDELGIDPGPDLERLAQDVRNCVAPALPAG